MKKALIVLLLFLAACGQQADTVKIGVIVPLTGVVSYIGVEVQEGVLLAQEEINAQGGIDGKLLEIRFEDGKGDSPTTVTSFHNLMATFSPDVVIEASAALAVTPLAQEAQIPMLATVSSSSQVASQGDQIFRLFTNADSDSPVIAGYAVDTLGFKKIAILYVDELFGHSYRDVFTRIVKEKGGEVVVVEAITYTEWDYSTQLLKVKQAQPDALYIIGIENQITNAMDQMDVLDILDIPLLAVGTIATPNGVAAMTKHETQAFTSAFCLDAMPGDYIGKFMTKYEKFPGFFSTFGYDSVMLIKDAVSRRGTGHQGIRDGLATVQDFESTVGTVSVDAQGEMAFPMCPKQVSEKGILNLVSGNYYDLG